MFARQFSDINGFQNTAFATQFNRVEQEWILNTKFTDITGKCAQIHHTGQDHFVTSVQIKVITKLPNSEQSYKGKVKTHNYINRQNQSTTGKL